MYYFCSMHVFIYEAWLVFFCGSSNNSKFPQVSRTFVNILVDLDNDVVRIVAIFLISYSSCLFPNFLGTVSISPITISNTVTHTFPSFLVLRQSLTNCLAFRVFSWSSISTEFTSWEFLRCCLLTLSELFWLGLGDSLLLATSKWCVLLGVWVTVTLPKFSFHFKAF